MRGHPTAGDSSELWFGSSLGCRRHTDDLQSGEILNRQSSLCDQGQELTGSSEAEDGLLGIAPHSRRFLNKSTVFLRPVGGEDGGSTHSGKYNTAVLCLCFSYNKKAIKCGMS